MEDPLKTKQIQIQITFEFVKQKPNYLWGEEGDDGGEVGDETKESEAGEDHSLAPELKLLPHLGSGLDDHDLTGCILQIF